MTDREANEDLRVEIHLLCDVILDGITDAFRDRGYWCILAFYVVNGLGAMNFCDSRFEKARAVVNRLLSERATVLPEEVVETNDALDEGRRGGAVHDVGNREVDAGQKLGNSVIGLLSNCCEKFDEKLAIAKALKVENGLVVGDGTFDGCNIGDGKFSLFGICADYFTKFETPGWIPETERDYLSTLSFVQAFLGYKEGIEWVNGHRVFGWREIKG